MQPRLPESLTQKINNYHVPSSSVELIKSARIVFLVGIAGAGKDTVINELLKSKDYHYIISHTTRPPRYNNGVLERDGIEYHFISMDEAERMLDDREFIEAKVVHGSNVYGTSIKEIQEAKDKSEIAISEIEVQGIAEYRAVADNVLPIFLLPPSFTVWQERLVKRSDKVDVDEIKGRMETAKLELQEALSKDYFEFVINDDLSKTIAVVDEIAHGMTSQKKNQEAKALAEKLLNQLQKST